MKENSIEVAVKRHKAAGCRPRVALADWMADPKNPFFAKTVANRYFRHFFSRGIVDPLDDLRVTNPPTNPKLLDALAQELIAGKFSLKHLIRVICTSPDLSAKLDPERDECWRQTGLFAVLRQTIKSRSSA